MAWSLAQHIVAELIRVLPRRGRHLIDEGFDNIALNRRADRPPEAVWNSRIRFDVFHTNIRNVVGQRRGAIDRDPVDTIWRKRPKPFHQRLLNETLHENGSLAGTIHRSPHTGVTDRAVEIVLNIVFAAPDHLHRFAYSLRCLDSIGDKIRLAAAAETASEIRRVNVHRLSGKP